MLFLALMLLGSVAAIAVLYITAERQPSAEALRFAISPTAAFKFHRADERGGVSAWREAVIDSQTAVEIIQLAQGAEPEVLDDGWQWTLQWGLPPIRSQIPIPFSPLPDDAELQVFESGSHKPTLRIGFLTWPERDYLRVNLWGPGATTGFHIVPAANRPRLFELLRSLAEVPTATELPADHGAAGLTAPETP